MAGVVKKFSLLLFILSFLCLSSCSKDSVFVDTDAVIKENTEQMMQCIIDRNAEKLLTFFSDDMRENESEKTLEEIEQLFDFIDGDIVSYSYSSGGLYGSVSNSEYELYLCEPTFQKTETSTEKIYTIQFAYDYIWKGKPEYEGISKIIAFPGEDWGNRDEGVTVGKYHELPSVWE
ncbi:MAG: DUF5104 domain-containing protein [Bacteroides sp.]|nr:DUF5104 domain-containing protein [Eubacterium sp.]MCM1419192.1 DUF5104 domain-containing protein [Roseburia sp.]MCM1463041.1 DUF5104 domain-containing protein [Bacteroides sp.]